MSSLAFSVKVVSLYLTMRWGHLAQGHYVTMLDQVSKPGPFDLKLYSLPPDHGLGCKPEIIYLFVTLPGSLKMPAMYITTL